MARELLAEVPESEVVLALRVLIGIREATGGRRFKAGDELEYAESVCTGMSLFALLCRRCWSLPALDKSFPCWSTPNMGLGLGIGELSEAVLLRGLDIP